MSTEQALEIYDALPPVSIEFMIGRWKGAECDTGHPMDGLLEATGWYGKHFVDAETVHPLLFPRGKHRLYAVNPALVPLSNLIPKWGILKHVMALLGPLVQTRKSRARLRMVEFRCKSSAAMVYDARAINDCFRKLDDDTVLGLMDLKGMEQPYFFLLERDTSEKRQRYHT